MKNMTTRETWKDWAVDLDHLGTHDAPIARVDRIRTRCLAALAARRRAIERQPGRKPARLGWLAPAFAVGLSLIYVAAAIGTVLQLARVVRVAQTLVP